MKRTSWVLAEGATIAGFNTFYLLQNPNATAVYSPGLVKIDAPNSLVIKRETIEEQLGQRYDLQQMQVNLVTLSGHIDEDDDQFTLSWNH